MDVGYCRSSDAQKLVRVSVPLTSFTVVLICFRFSLELIFTSLLSIFDYPK